MPILTQPLTLALENQFQTSSTDCILAVVSPLVEAVAKGYSITNPFSLRDKFAWSEFGRTKFARRGTDKEVRPQKVRMRERRKPLNCKSYSLTLQALTPAHSRRERELIDFCDCLVRCRNI